VPAGHQKKGIFCGREVRILKFGTRRTGNKEDSPCDEEPFSDRPPNPLSMTIETYTGITGILRPFREFIQGLHLQPGDQVVYYGCTGTCTPFVELLAMAVRGMHYEQVFVPYLDETKARELHEVADTGMQVSSNAVSVHPKVMVIMGGLAMPYMPVAKEQVRDLAAVHREVTIAGVCFQDMFEKAGWLDTVHFDLLISAIIDPVKVTKRT